MPAVDGGTAGEEDGGDDGPGDAGVEQQENVRPLTLLVTGRRLEMPQQGLAFARPKRDTAIHGLDSRVVGVVTPTLTQAILFLQLNRTAVEVGSYLAGPLTAPPPGGGEC